MSTEIGLIADIHAAAGPLREALAIFKRERVDLILCIGDIAGYGTELEQCIELLIEGGCRTVLGNHDLWYLDSGVSGRKQWVVDFFTNLSATWEATIEGKRIFAVHASPPDSMTRGITLLDQYENIIAENKKQWSLELESYGFDTLLVGHTHQVFAEFLGQTLVINPGSTRFNNSCALLNLPEQEVRIVPLPGKSVNKVWHWGMKSG